MLLNRRTRIFLLSLRCLLSLWLFFCCLELAEELQFVTETVAEDQAGQDLDEEALSQLASGIKSDVSGLLTPDNLAVINTISEKTTSVLFTTFHHFKRLNPPFSLPLYQQFSVYRI
jgi:hypothetical protein